MHQVLFSSQKHDWKTPKSLFRCLERLFGKFDLDPCTEDNHLQVPYYYTSKDNGLVKEWFGRVYVNPPYSETEKWVRKAIQEVKEDRAKQVVMLLASRTDTRWFHELVLPNATEILFIKGRIRFEGARDSAPFPSLVVVFEKVKSRAVGSLDPKLCKVKYMIL